MAAAAAAAAAAAGRPRVAHLRASLASAAGMSGAFVPSRSTSYEGVAHVILANPFLQLRNSPTGTAPL